jgi:multisubunit Na+/H+ antiporter MnhG subunit
MSASDIAATALLAVGVAVELCCAVGVLWMRDAYDRLHYSGPASTVGAAAVAAEGLATISLKAILVAALLAVANAAVTHATARAMWIRRHGRWRLPCEDDDERP